MTTHFVTVPLQTDAISDANGALVVGKRVNDPRRVDSPELGASVEL
jgi:hypothetical protein